MKLCRECGQELPAEQFYRHAAMLDGRLNKCKKCVKRRVSKHREKNVEKIREYDRQRSKTPERQKHLRDNAAQYREHHPDRYRATTAVGNALRDGRLIKPSQCSECGALCHVHAHHADYSRPLDVVWLCPICHSQKRTDTGGKDK